MGTYVESLFKENVYEKLLSKIGNGISPIETFIKVLPENTEIYRSGYDEVIEPRVSRSRKNTKKVINQQRLPQFFAPAHVAFLYGKKGLTMYTFKTESRLPLLYVEPSLLNFLWTNVKNSGISNDIKIIKDLFFILGYNPETDPVLKNEWILEFLQWAKKIVEKSTDIRIDAQGIGQFNRISVSKNDRDTLNRFLNHKFSNDVINKVIDVADGIYFPVMRSGFYNPTNFISLFGFFHEEIFLKDSVVRKNINPLKELLFNNDYYLEAFRVVGRVLDDKIVQDPIETNKSILMSYIYSFQQLYSYVGEILDSIIKEDIPKYYTSAESQYKRDNKLASHYTFFRPYMEVEEHIIVYNPHIQYLQLQIYSLLQDVFIIPPQHFVNIPNEIDIYTSKIDIFIFNTISNIVKSICGLFQNVLDIFKLQNFIPIASGGILFNMYGYGEYLRKTKDVDIKITEKYKNEDYTDQENKHALLVVLEYIWIELSTTILNAIINQRIEAFTNVLVSINQPIYEKYKTYRNFQVLKKYTTTYFTTLDKIFYKYVSINHPNDSQELFSIKVWNDYFFKNSKITLIEFDIKIKDLLKAKKNIPKNSEERLKINKNIVEYTKEYNKLFISFLNSIHINTKYPSILSDINNIYFISRSRGSIGDETMPFKIGYFATIDIHHTDTNINYGIIDYTIDTEYSSYFTFQKKSNIHISSAIKLNNLLYASFFDFITETIKLNKICSTGYIFNTNASNQLLEYNPFNECAPHLKTRNEKKIKYRERYALVLGLCNQVLPTLNTLYTNILTNYSNSIQIITNIDSLENISKSTYKNFISSVEKINDDFKKRLSTTHKQLNKNMNISIENPCVHYIFTIIKLRSKMGGLQLLIDGNDVSRIHTARNIVELNSLFYEESKKYNSNDSYEKLVFKYIKQSYILNGNVLHFQKVLNETQDSLEQTFDTLNFVCTILSVSSHELSNTIYSITQNERSIHPLIGGKKVRNTLKNRKGKQIQKK